MKIYFCFIFFIFFLRIKCSLGFENVQIHFLTLCYLLTNIKRKSILRLCKIEPVHIYKLIDTFSPFSQMFIYENAVYFKVQEFLYFISLDFFQFPFLSNTISLKSSHDKTTTILQ